MKIAKAIADHQVPIVGLYAGYDDRLKLLD